MSDLQCERLPTTGRLAAIDYGTVRLGVAVTDPDQGLASPLENYTRRGEALDARWLSELTRQERLAGIVIGLPVHTSGLESQKSIEARKFGAWVKQVTGLPVVFFDERYTSAHAEELLLAAEFTKKRRKQRLDMLAAQILLTAYLESTSRGEGEPAALED
jgi:putative holliday junction resolvase